MQESVVELSKQPKIKVAKCQGVPLVTHLRVKVAVGVDECMWKHEMAA